MSALARGFSLIELLITVAIIGIVSAVAIPAYQAYIETANMTKVNAAYEHAIRMAQEEFTKNQTRVSMGLPPTIPDSEEGWMTRLNKDNQAQAPGGGPAFIPASGKGKGKGMGKDKGPEEDYGDPEETGAIALDVKDDGARLDIYRPAYLDLKPFQARVTVDSLEVKEL